MQEEQADFNTSGPTGEYKRSAQGCGGDQMQLRDYQSKTIKDLYSKLMKTKKVLLVAPTGSGKTLMSTHVISDIISSKQPRKVFFIVHREELVLQTKATLEKYGINEKVNIVKSGYSPSSGCKITIASIQTMASRKIMPQKEDVVFFDEAHTVAFYTYSKKLIEEHPGFIIGLTATPWRSKRSEGLAHLFDEFVNAPAVSDLISMGHLCDATHMSFKPTFNLKHVKVRGGDYALEELSKACNTEESNKYILNSSLEYRKNSSASIVFAVDCKHATDLGKILGYEVVLGETDRMKRAEIYKKLRAGLIGGIVSVGVLTEGFDAVNVDLVMLCRPTKSRALNVQMIGRGLRIDPNNSEKLCTILDYAENYKRHGLAHKITVEEMAPDYAAPKGIAPTKICKQCMAVVMTTADACDQCGYEFPKSKICKEELSGILKEVVKKPNPTQSRMDYGALLMDAFMKNHSPNKAKIMFQKKYHRFPSNNEMIMSAFNGGERNKVAFYEYLCRQAEKHDKPNMVKIHMKREFGYITT